MFTARRPCPVALDDSFAERFAHARDLWPRGTLKLAADGGAVLPAAVARPASEQQLLDVLAWASETRIALVPWGAGSGVCGGATGAAGAVSVDTKRLRRIGPLDVEGGTVRVEAGVLGQHLETWLEARGFATRHSPSSIACSTVGGWAVTRSAGQFSSRYGTFPDMVRGARVASPVGSFGAGSLRVGDDAWTQTGADPRDVLPWILGTEGQLGVVSLLDVAVVPLAEARRLGGWRFADTHGALAAMRALMQSDLRPLALRLYDPADTRIAGKGTATKAGSAAWLATLTSAVDSVPTLRRHALALPLSLPRLLNALVAAAATGCVLIVGWEGSPAEVARDAAQGDAILAAHGGISLGEGPGEHWYAHRHDVSYKVAPIFSHGGFADTMEVAAPWSKLVGLYDAVRGELSRHALVMAHFSHAYREGCSIYFTFAGRGSLEVYDAAWSGALRAAAAAGGTVAHHHGVGVLKQHASAREQAAAAPAFREIKRALDPEGVLNPGRLFPDVPPPPEPAVPSEEVDAVSRTATLDAHAEAPARDGRLAALGWTLRYPTSRTLAAAARDMAAAPRSPVETPIVGATVRVGGRRYLVSDAPRSSAGPDLRACFPPDAYETLTVPVDPT